MTTLTKYVLLQVPGWLLLALLLLGLWYWLGLPLWGVAGLFALWVAKDFVLYPFVRPAYESNARTGAEQLINAGG